MTTRLLAHRRDGYSGPNTCASLLFDGGRNVKQISEWLGHTDPSFTLRTYVHLMDAGVGEAEFLDEVVRVNTGSTGRPETAANGSAVESPQVPA